MDQVMDAPRTPARGPSNVARGDLLGRIQGLGLSPEVAPRVLRLVERELEAAADAQRQHHFSLDDVRQAGGEDSLIEALEALRRDRERARAIAAAGLAGLSAEELEAVIADARNGRS